VVEENGQIAQVFVEAELPEGDEDERTRTIKSVVRSIIGAVALNHDLQLDYRKIKVVEYKPAEESGLVIHPRIQIGAAFLRRFPRRETVVELHVLGRTAVGTWPSTDNPAQDAYYACVNALAGLGYTGFELVYLEILHNDFANEKIVLLKVKYATVPGGEETLLGVAEIQEDLPLAVVKAVLNAINRRIGLPTRT
jgi:hypothetical protein